MRKVEKKKRKKRKEKNVVLVATTSLPAVDLNDDRWNANIGFYREKYWDGVHFMHRHRVS